jgi:hypothetical protein
VDIPMDSGRGKTLFCFVFTAETVDSIFSALIMVRSWRFELTLESFEFPIRGHSMVRLLPVPVRPKLFDFRIEKSALLLVAVYSTGQVLGVLELPAPSSDAERENRFGERWA